MAHSNGIITAPINIETDIYAVLGIGPTAQGYDIGYACYNTHNKINKWSKYKPVKAGIPGSDIKSIYTNYNCSLQIGRATTIETCVVLSNNNNNDWAYLPSDEWARSTDFDGYNHNALNPSTSATPSGQILQRNGYKATFSFGADLSITDFPNFSPTFGSATNMYFGVAVIRDTSPTIVGWITSGSTIKDGGYNVTIPVNSLELNKKYRAMAFLAGGYKTSWVGSFTGTNEFIYLPQKWSEFTVIESYIRVSITQTSLSFSTKLAIFHITVANDSDTTVNVGGTYWLKYEGRAWNTPIMAGEKTGPIGIIIAEPHKVTSKEFRVTNTGDGNTLMYAHANINYKYGGDDYGALLKTVLNPMS